MANENDGSLVFDTEIDNSGFEKGSDKLLAAIKDLTSAVDNMGDNMMRSFGKVIPLLQTVANAATNASSGITDTATQAADANERVIDSEQRVAQAAERAADAVNQQDNATGSFTRSVENTQGSVSALEREVNSLSTGLQSVSNSAELGFANGKAVLTFDSKIQALEQRLTEARERLAEFGNTNIPTEEYNALTAQISRAEQALFRLYDRRDDMAALGVKENSAQWERLALQIQNAEDQLARFERERDSLAANGGAFIQGSETAEFARMESALNAAGETLERNKGLIDQEALAQARLNVLTAQEAVAAATTTSEREAAIARLREAQEQLNNLAQSMSNGQKDDATTEKWKNMVTLSDKLKSAFAGIRDTATLAFTAIRHPIQAVDRALGALMQSAKSAAHAVGQSLKGAFQSVASHVGSLAKNLAKLPFQAVKNGFQKITGSIKNFVSRGKNANNLAHALTKSLTSLKTMLVSRVKRMFISGIFNEAKESLQTLAKFSDTFNQSMSNIKNSSKELSANISVSLGNIITSLEPMITALLDKLSTAFTFINALFAKLSGKTTMTVAKKQTDSYRDSLDGAAKSAEDLKNQVYGFDELNKRSGKDEDKVTDGSDLYEEVPIDSILPENIKKLFDELKELWENGDYFNFGKKLAELLNDGLQTLDDWINNTFRPKGKEWAKNIAEILNGLVDGFDWTLLGKTVADGINAAFDIINTFLTTFDFEKLGKGIGEAINGWFSNIEWDLIGKTFGNKWNALIDLIHGAVTTIDWANIGDSVAKGVSSFFDTVDWDKLAETITTSINGIVEAFQHFIDGIDWENAGKTVGNFGNTLVNGIKWDEIGTLIGSGLQKIVDLLHGFVTEFKWDELGTKFGSGCMKLWNSIDWAKAGETLSAGVIGLLNTLTKAIEEIDWQKVGNDVATFIAAIDWSGVFNALCEGIGAALGALAGFLWGLIKDAWESTKEYFRSYIEEYGGDVIAGLWAGIKNAFINVGTWIKENILDPFIEGFKRAFGINSPSKVMMEMGEYLIEGLLQGIKNVWNAITSFFSTAVEGIKNLLSKAWDTIKTAASTAWENIKSTISQKFNAVKDAVSKTAENIKSALSTAWNNIKSAASTAWDNVKSTVSKKFEEAKNAVSKTAETIKTALSTAWNNIKSAASTAWDNVKSTVTKKFEDAKTALSKTADNIKSALSTAWNNIKSTASSVWDNVKSTVTKKFEEVKTSLSNTANNIKSTVTSAWENIKTSTSQAWNTLKSTVVGLWNGLKSTLQNTSWSDVGSNLVSGLQRGISSAWSAITSTVSSLASGITSTLRSIFSIHSPSKVWAEIGEYLDLGLMKGLKDEEKTVLSTVSDMAKDINDEISGRKATLQIGAEGDGMVSRLGSISDKLAEIVGAFRAINDSLTGLDGFRVPVIATGSEVPYKTRIGADANNTQTIEMSSDMDEVLSDHTYLLRRILELLEKSKIGIDSDELAQAIAFAMRGVSRGYGGV